MAGGTTTHVSVSCPVNTSPLPALSLPFMAICFAPASLDRSANLIGETMAEFVAKIIECDWDNLIQNVHPEKFYDVKEEVKPIASKRCMNSSAIPLFLASVAVFVGGLIFFESKTDTVITISDSILAPPLACSMISSKSARPLQFTCAGADEARASWPNDPDPAASKPGLACMDTEGRYQPLVVQQYPDQFYKTYEDCLNSDNWQKACGVPVMSRPFQNPPIIAEGSLHHRILIPEVGPEAGKFIYTFQRSAWRKWALSYDNNVSSFAGEYVASGGSYTHTQFLACVSPDGKVVAQKGYNIGNRMEVSRTDYQDTTGDEKKWAYDAGVGEGKDVIAPFRFGYNVCEFSYDSSRLCVQIGEKTMCFQAKIKTADTQPKGGPVAGEFLSSMFFIDGPVWTRSMDKTKNEYLERFARPVTSPTEDLLVQAGYIAKADGCDYGHTIFKAVRASDGEDVWSYKLSPHSFTASQAEGLDAIEFDGCTTNPKHAGASIYYQGSKMQFTGDGKTLFGASRGKSGGYGCIHAVNTADGTNKWTVCKPYGKMRYKLTRSGTKLIVFADGTGTINNAEPHKNNKPHLATLNPETGKEILKFTESEYTLAYGYGGLDPTLPTRTGDFRDGEQTELFTLSWDGTELFIHAKPQEGKSENSIVSLSTVTGQPMWQFMLGDGFDSPYLPVAHPNGKSVFIQKRPVGKDNAAKWHQIRTDHCTVDAVRYESEPNDVFKFTENSIVLDGANVAECASSWNTTICDDSHPIGAKAKARFCEAYVRHPPYSCSEEVKKPFSENISLAFGFSELVYMGAIFLVVIILRKCSGEANVDYTEADPNLAVVEGDEAKAKDDTDARSGRPRASTRGTNRGSNARQRKSRALEEANDATVFNAPDDALDAASTTSGYEEALESLAETSTPTGDDSHGANGYLAVTGASEDQNNLKSSTLVPVQTYGENVAPVQPYGENAADNEFAGFGGSDDSVQQADAGGFTVGQCGQPCIVAGVGSGTIRFVGLHAINGEPRVGVELNKPKGKNNGTVKGHTYFVCADGFGTLTIPSKITIQGTEL